MKKEKILFVVSHVDDEAIFFAGAILRHREHQIEIACVTRPKDPKKRAWRSKMFQKSTKMLQVSKVYNLNFSDHEERLPVRRISRRLKELGKFDRVFTHGIAGEYGHAHHQDVAFAVHECFAKLAERRRVYSLSKFERPDLSVILTSEEFSLKMKLLFGLYVLDVMAQKAKVPFPWIEGYSTKTFGEVRKDYPSEGNSPALLGQFLKAHVAP